MAERFSPGRFQHWEAGVGGRWDDANVATLAERILGALRYAPLDDDVLAKRLGVGHRQAVNQAARRLEAQGRLRRFVAPNGKILNALTDGAVRQIPEPIPPQLVAVPATAESFSSFVQEQIGWYVYVLRDPRDGRVFYVGKGTGNRVFQHAQDAATLHDSAKPKLGRIRAIHAAGLQVVTELVRHHIPTEKTAYLVEASVIDAMRAAGLELANEVKGHHSAVYGWASTAVAASVYEAPPLPEVHEALVMFKIPKLWTPAITEAELYEATRGWWVLGPKARRAKYALAVNKGVTRGVWRIEYWRERVAGDRDYDPAEVPPRVGFSGAAAPEMNHLLNRSIKHLPQGAGAVAVYLNCADDIQPAELLTGAAAASVAGSERT